MVVGEREPVGRALDVLTWLASNPRPPWSVRQVARALEMSPTTIHRIFGVFEGRGLLDRDGDGGYVAGIELYLICHSVAAQLSPVPLVRHHLEALCEKCDETVLLGAYDPKRTRMMFIDVVESPHPVQYLSTLNEWMPVHSGATGIAIFAFLTEPERKAIYAKGLEQVTDRTLVTERELEKAVQRVHELGYVCSRGQRTPGAVGIAAPVFDSAGNVFGDVCITIPEQRFEDSMAETVGAAVRETSEVVTGELRRAGYRRGVA
ncbi:MAG TPA: IclR family transcriptional regulator [Streptosporangiaceae bacterium]|jgi:DNA-binding IclR family transcriptional regulator